jgi:hypothetical protein
VPQFFTDPRTPCTNDLAEQDGWMMKLWQKISRGFRYVTYFLTWIAQKHT